MPLNTPTFLVGDRVLWRGALGAAFPREARIICADTMGDLAVYDLDNGHWAYSDQLSPLPSQAVNEFRRALETVTTPILNFTGKVVPFVPRKV